MLPPQPPSAVRAGARIVYKSRDDGRVSVSVTFTPRSLEVLTNIGTSSILGFRVFLG